MSTDDPCPVHGCTTPKRAGDLMCRSHWFQVPQKLRREVLRLWHQGPSTDYLLARKQAIDAAQAATLRNAITEAPPVATDRTTDRTTPEPETTSCGFPLCRRRSAHVHCRICNLPIADDGSYGCECLD